MERKEDLSSFYVKVDYVVVSLISVISAFGIIFVLFLPKVIQYIEFSTTGQGYTDMYYYLLEAPLSYLLIIFIVILFWAMSCRKNLKDNNKLP